MNSIDLEKLTAAWVELQRTPSRTPRYGELFWSFEAIQQLIAVNPLHALDVILAILVADQSQTTYENLSAGPLEDLLAGQGHVVIERIETEAAQNPNFRTLLGGVWENQIEPHIWGRFKRCRDRRGWDGIPE